MTKYDFISEAYRCLIKYVETGYRRGFLPTDRDDRLIYNDSFIELKITIDKLIISENQTNMNGFVLASMLVLDVYKPIREVLHKQLEDWCEWYRIDLKRIVSFASGVRAHMLDLEDYASSGIFPYISASWESTSGC